MINKIGRDIISYFFIASFFITGSGIGEIGFTIYWYYPFYILFLTYGLIFYHKLDSSLLYFSICLIIYSILSIEYGTEGVLLMIKQLVNLVMSISIFYFFILHEKFNLIEIFKKFISFSKIVLVIGFAQSFIFLTETGADYFLSIFSFLKESNISYRFQSITQEPSFIAYLFAPVVYISLCNFFNKKYLFINRVWSIMFLAAYLLTFSLTAYLGLIFMLLLIYFKNITYAKLVFSGFFFLALIAISLFVYSKVPFITTRVDDTLSGIKNDIMDPLVYENINLSTFTFLSNLKVTIEAIKENPMMGSGLGTHSLNYDTYLPLILRNYSSLNREDANSLMLRLLSETGLIGFALFLFFLLKFRVKFWKTDDGDFELLRVINTGILIMCILCLIRNGNYTIGGRVMFLLMYYYSFKASKKIQRSHSLI